MAGYWFLLFLLCIYCLSVVSAQSVMISGNTANPDENVALTCTLLDYDTTGLTLEYEWSLSSVVLQRSSSNEYAIPNVRVTDAKDGYTCSVFNGDETVALATGTNSLNITIPDFSMRFLRDPTATARFDYAGLNITYICQTSFLFALTDLTADVEVFLPNEEMAIESSDLRVGVTDTVMDGSNFERTLYFYPISANDVGEYRCTGTIRPAVTNPYVTNGRGEFRRELSVFETTLSVQVSGAPASLLDFSPYNNLSLTCTADAATTRGPAPVYMNFDWSRVVGVTPPYNISTNSFTNSRQFGDSVSSTLTLYPDEVGNHTYFCIVQLDVSDVSGMDMTTVEVIGPTQPSPLEDVTVPPETLTQDSATIQWRVSALQYGPELYRVLYGNSSDTDMTSANVSSGNDITRTDFVVSVKLGGLEFNTMYHYSVEAINSAGSVQSDVLIFTTTGLPPTPPMDLATVEDSTTPTTYVFTWRPPSDIRGELTQYLLTCMGLSVDDMRTVAFEPSVNTGAITDLMYTSYNCSLQASNMEATSVPSNTVDIIINETAPGVVSCGMGWEATPTNDSFNVTVTWGEPVDANGIILHYLLEFTSYSGDELTLGSVVVNAPITSHTFTALTLMEGVPYNVSILARNSAGEGTDKCFQTDFSAQLAPPPVRDLVVDISASRTEINLAWRVPSLVEARGFVVYIVTFEPSGGRKRRQEGGVCSQSPCSVNVEMGGVILTGLDPRVNYVLTVQPVNEDMVMGDPIEVTVDEPPPDFPLLLVIVVVVVGALLLGISILLCVICIVCCCHRSKNKEYGVKPEVRVEMEKRKDYVNDTVLCDQHGPLYQPMQGTDRVRSIPITKFSYHVREMHGNRDRGFEEEYESLDNDASSFEISKLNNNKNKNRFANIFPYDFSRVKLEVVEGREGSDYINASYIDGYKQANAYIAAQGPMPSTIGDFWRMIWEKELTAVVMLTKVNEAGKKKCEQYWPDEVGQTVSQPDCSLHVTLKEIQPFADYEIRKLEVIDVSSVECRAVPLPVIQYHFLGWPDLGVPKFASSLIEFIRRVRHSYKSDKPILVHCGAGVGRTGTYITLDSMLERMKDPEMDDINVYQCVRNMRSKRVLMVQTQAQYMFIHDALDELITCGQTAIQAPELREELILLNKVDPMNMMTGFEQQFQVLYRVSPLGLLGQVSRIPTDSDLSDALQHYNEHKNRYQNKVPYNANRVRLRPEFGITGSEYINASFVDGYKHRNAYIATQGPLESTVTDFWRMIWEFKSRLIVMLCPTEEDGEESSYRYWPETKGEELSVGKLQVTLLAENVCREHVERELEIKEPKADGTPGQGFKVTQFHYQQWPDNDRPPTSTGLLQVIKSLNKLRRNTGNKPVTIMCNDGVGRTGSFICIHAMMERVNTENILDFFQFIKSSRIHRPSLIMELEHYRFCHDALADYLNSLDSYANFKNLQRDPPEQTV